VARMYGKTDQKRENESMIGEGEQEVASRVVGLCKPQRVSHMSKGY
jgi:hypothetical protein